MRSKTSTPKTEKRLARALAACVAILCICSRACASGNADPLSRGVKQLKAGNLTQALASLRGAAESAPDDARAWYWLGRTRYARGEHRKAADAFARVRKLSPAYEAVTPWLGLSLYHCGEYEQAIPPLRRALERTPANGAVSTALGAALYRTGDPSGARPVLEAALAMQGSSAFHCRYFLGLIAADDGEFLDAWRHFEKALEHAQSDRQRKKAARALESLSGRSVPHAPRAASNLETGITLGFVYDSNVSFSPDDVSASDRADTGTSAAAWLWWRRREAPGRTDLSVFAQVFDVRYEELDEYHMTGMSAKVTGVTPHRLRPTLGAEVAYYTLADDPLLVSSSLEGGMAIPAGGRCVIEPSVRLALKDYRGDTYAGLDAWLQEAGLRIRSHPGALRGAFELQAFRNDADDDEHSCTGGRCRGRLEWRPTRRCRLDVSVTYEGKEYEDEYPGAGEERSDRKLRLSSGVRWRIDDTVTLGLRITLTDNDSNIDEREYSREQYALTLGFVF